MITGASGRGKSTLALQLMSMGADLVADDRTVLRADQGLWASVPASLAGLIEARGVGLLTADHVPQTRIALVVDLDQDETDRLPPARQITLLGQNAPLLLRVQGPHFAPALMQILKHGRRSP